MTTDAAVIFVVGGVASFLGVLITAIFNRRLNSANYAKIVAELSGAIAKDLRQDNIELKAEVAGLDKAVDELREHVSVLIGQLNIAIPLLEAQGIDTAQMREAIRIRRGHVNGVG